MEFYTCAEAESMQVSVEEWLYNFRHLKTLQKTSLLPMSELELFNIFKNLNYISLVLGTLILFFLYVNIAVQTHTQIWKQLATVHSYNGSTLRLRTTRIWSSLSGHLHGHVTELRPLSNLYGVLWSHDWVLCRFCPKLALLVFGKKKKKTHTHSKPLVHLITATEKNCKIVLVVWLIHFMTVTADDHDGLAPLQS